MKKSISFVLSLLLVCFSFCFVGCNDDDTINYLNIPVYYEENVICYNVDNTSTTIPIGQLIGNETPTLNRYNQIILDGKSKWTYDLYIEYLEFDLYSTESLNYDFTLSISNLEQSETAKYSETYFWHFSESFYMKPEANTLTHKKIDINETCNSEEGGIALVLDKDSTLALSSTVKYYITNLKIVAYHK